jgi:hypothetical protein
MTSSSLDAAAAAAAPCLQALLHVIFSRHMEALQQQLGQQDGALLQQVRLL